MPNLFSASRRSLINSAHVAPLQGVTLDPNFKLSGTTLSPNGLTATGTVAGAANCFRSTKAIPATGAFWAVQFNNGSAHTGQAGVGDGTMLVSQSVGSDAGGHSIGIVDSPGRRYQGATSGEGQSALVDGSWVLFLYHPTRGLHRGYPNGSTKNWDIGGNGIVNPSGSDTGGDTRAVGVMTGSIYAMVSPIGANESMLVNFGGQAWDPTIIGNVNDALAAGYLSLNDA